MKSFFVLASCAVAAVAQRLTIVSPVETNVTRASPFVTELHQDETTSSLSQVSVTISANPCYDSCLDPSTWGAASVLYYGAFNPQFNASAPQKGLYEDFTFTLPEDWPQGESVLQVAHLYELGAAGALTFDYTNVHFNVD